MFCKNCGNEIKEKEKFCSKCGKKVVGKMSRDLIVFIIGIILLIILIITGIILKNSYNIGNPSNSNSQLSEEMKEVKTNFVYTFNQENLEEYNGGGKNHIANANKYNWKIDNSKAKLVTITEDMLNIEFIENYNNYNIYHITSKIKDGLMDVHTTKTSFAPNYTITVESSPYENGVYVCLKDDKIIYNPDINYVREEL